MHGNTNWIHEFNNRWTISSSYDFQAHQQRSQRRCCFPRLLYCDSRCSQTYRQRSQVSPRRSQMLPDAPRLLVGAPRLLPCAPSYSEGRKECPPRVWYSPDIDASKFTLHILSDTPGGFQWPKYILLMKNKKISKATRQLSAHWCTRHLQLWPISHSQSLHFAETISGFSPAISPPPKEFSSISNPPPTFDSLSAALAAMISWLATQTQIGWIIVPTANRKVVTSAFSATELSRASHEWRILSPRQPLKPNTSLVPRAPAKQSGYSSSTKVYTAKTQLRSRSIATIRAHLVISELGS